jgi:hypothetical protein
MQMIVMPSWIACIQLLSDNFRENIHVNLDSSIPYWNDAIGGFLLQLTGLYTVFQRRSRRTRGFDRTRTKARKAFDYFCESWRPFSTLLRICFGSLREISEFGSNSVRREWIPAGDLFEQLNYLGIARDLFDHLFMVFR